MTPPLILASTSIFRQQQLSKLGLTFTTAKPHYDETPRPNETPEHTALRLAQGKAQSLASSFSQHLIIGADQVAFCHNMQLGKPMNLANAIQMLSKLSGQRIKFFTALCLLNTLSGSQYTHLDETTVYMRSLTIQQIQHYLSCEPDAIYCAGAAKSEGLGATLIQRIESTDPNALIGLPIFRLIDFLIAEGMTIP